MSAIAVFLLVAGRRLNGKGRDLMELGLAVTLSGNYDSAVFEIYKMEQSK